MKKNYLLIFVYLVFSNLLHAQSLIGLSPNTTSSGEIITVAMSGQNTSFGQGTATTQVWFNQGSSTIFASSVNVSSTTNLTGLFTIPSDAPLGLYNANVSNSINGILTLPNAITITADTTAPIIASVTPNNGSLGQTIQVNLSGQNTNFMQGTGTLSFSQGSSTLSVSNVSVFSNNQITASLFIPNNALVGAYNVSTYNPLDGTVTLNNGFVVNPPGCQTYYWEITQQPLCPNSPGILTITGGYPPYHVSIGGQTYSCNNQLFFYPPGPGTFTIEQVVDNFGCLGEIAPTSSDFGFNLSNFSVSLVSNSVCPGSPVTFFYVANSPSPVTTVFYDYGDGTTGSSPTHTYQNSGTYYPQITVTNADGCIFSSTSASIVILNPPQLSVSSLTDATCGQNNGSFTIGTIGIAPFVYNVSGPVNFNSATNSTFSNLAQGVYTVSATDPNGCISSINVTVGNTTQQLNISGHISNPDGSSSIGSSVGLINMDDPMGVFPISASVLTDNQGNYSVSNLVEGNYLIQASPSAAGILQGAIPTYYASEALWYMADSVAVTCSSQSTADITMLDTTALGGNVQIGGDLIDVSGVQRKMASAFDPVVNADVLLFNNNSNNFVALKKTNNLGHYSFNGVSNGNYTIYVDMPGLNMIASHNINVQGNQNYTFKNFYVDTLNHTIDTFALVIWVGEKQLVKESLEAKVFPNPFSNHTTIQYNLEKNSTVCIEVYSAIGERVSIIENKNKTIGTYQNSIDLSSFGAGIYYVKCRINNSNKVFKIINTQ